MTTDANNVGFAILDPLVITDAILTSSTIAEDDAPLWVDTDPYTIGQQVMRPLIHKIFERRTNGTSATAPESDSVNWREVNSTNLYRLFGQSVANRTEAAESFTYVITPQSPVTGLYLGSVDAATVTVEMLDPIEGAVYPPRVISMTSDSGITDAYRYCFEPIERKNELLVADLLPYAGAAITITVSNPGGTAAVGVMLLGWIRNYGGTRFGARVGIKDYSEKTADEFGGFVVGPVERPFSKRARYTVLLDAAMVDVVARTLPKFRARAVLYIGASIYDALNVYGNFIDFDIVIPGELYSDCEIELEGLT